MKAAQFNYVCATSIQEALGILTASGERAKLLAGSQSLGPMLNLRLARPDTVVDVSKLAALQTVTRHQNFIRVGASVTHAQIEDGVFDGR
jgi:carbon-monoxide dehydrogenase medium subunit